MAEICIKCGLPKELCVCETIAKESQKIRIGVAKKAFGKYYTEITGIDDKEVNMKELAKNLKTKLACGGTIKEGKIELQGDHRNKVKEILIAAGFAVERIEIK
jgi:translation initiation factor 1